MSTPQNIPVPDPSALTIELLRKDLSALREVLEAKFHGRERVVDEKFTGLDDKIALVVQLGSKGLEAKIDAIEARMDRGDGKIVGQAYKDTSGDRTSSFTFSIIAVISSLIGMGIALISIFRH